MANYTKGHSIEKMKKTCYNTDNKLKKEEKKMSYMLVLANDKNVVIATDSRETFENGEHNDKRQKIFINENKTIAVGIIGPIVKRLGNTVYDIPKIIVDYIFKGQSVEQALKQEIDNISVKRLLQLKHSNEVLSVVVAKKGGFFEVIDYVVNENAYYFHEEIPCYYNGDFSNVLVSKMLGDHKELISLETTESLKEKAIQIMTNIIDSSIEISKITNIKSTIGGKIQCVVI